MENQTHDLSDIEPVYRRILESHPDPGSTLPDLELESEKARSFIAKLTQWLEQLLSALFPKPKTTNPNNILPLLIEAGKWLSLVLLTALILWIIYKLVSSVTARRTAPLKPTAEPAPERGEDALLKRVRDALAAGRFAEAARWRWKLFLKRVGLALTRTPAEIAREVSGSDTPDGTKTSSSMARPSEATRRLAGPLSPQEWAQLARTQYELMFAPTTEPARERESFTRIDETLSRIERQSAALTDGPTA